MLPGRRRLKTLSRTLSYENTNDVHAVEMRHDESLCKYAPAKEAPGFTNTLYTAEPQPELPRIHLPLSRPGFV